MIEASDLVQQRVLLDDAYQIWECQMMEPQNKNPDSMIVFTGKVGPLCRTCGGEMKDFAVRFRRSSLEGSTFKARDRVVQAIQDQLDE